MANGAGSQIYLGFGAETTPGVAASITSYIPVDPDNTGLNFDPAREALKLGMGTIFNDFTSVELAAKGNGPVQFPLWGGLGQDLLALCGLANGPITLPSYVTIAIGRVEALLVYAGCRAKSIEITATSSKPWMVKVDFDFIARPTETSIGSAPSFTAEKPFVWGDTQPATLAGSSNVIDIDNIKITINFNQVPFYGNHGNNLPSNLITTDVEVMGTFSKLFESVTEYNLFNAACMIPAQVVFAAISQCALAGGHTTAASVTFTMPNCIYTKQSFKNPLKGPITEEYSFTALSVSGGSPLTYAVNAES